MTGLLAFLAALAVLLSFRALGVLGGSISDSGAAALLAQAWSVGILMSHGGTLKSVIIYYSKYGSTKDYAEWLAQATGAELVPLAEAKKLDLSGFDAVVFGCPYYAFRLKIAGLVKSWVPRLAGKKVAFFAVGGEEPTNPDCRKVYDTAFPDSVRAAMRFFYFPGRIALGRMSWFDRLIMKLMKAKDYDHTSRDVIAPLVEFLKG